MKKQLMLLTLCTALLAGCGKEAPVEEEPTLRSVEVATLGTDSIANSFSYTGKAAPSKEISVVPTVPGKVLSYNFEVGDSVREGQVLFSVDSSSYSDQLRSVDANYNASMLNLQNAEKLYNNNKVLFEEGIISQAELDQLALAYESAKASIEALEVNRDILKKNMGDCTVTSPMSGVIVSRSIERGSFASQTSPAYVIMDLSTIKVEVGVSEQTVNTIKIGDSVQVTMTAASDTPLTGKVSTISPAASQTGTYSVSVTLGNADGAIKSGMLAEVTFVKEKADDALILPRSAVLTKDGETYVFVIQNDTAVKTPVTVGIDTGETIQITSELPEGTQVVTRGQTYISDGEKVTISEPVVAEKITTEEDTAKEE
ncbi:MAG: efflux RND transporter periplasmic adaptor subunit [Anaerotignum sp.]